VVCRKISLILILSVNPRNIRISLSGCLCPTTKPFCTSDHERLRSHRSSTSNTEVDALDCRASQQRRVPIPSRMQPMEDEQQRYPPSLTFSSSSTGTDSVVTTPAFGYFSGPEIKKIKHICMVLQFQVLEILIFRPRCHCHERALSAGR
jgi:hypothetical protein